MKVLITSGGCKVPIDDVRHIGNFSSGRYGASLADAFTEKGYDVIFFCEKGSKEPDYVYHKFADDGKILDNVNPRVIRYKDYYEYLSVKDLIKNEQPDIIISAAAISDYIVEKVDGKLSSDDELTLRLVKGEKVIKSFRELSPNAVIVGFKLLVGPSEEEKEKAIKKVFNSGVDFVIYNDLLELRKGNSQREIHYNFLGYHSAKVMETPDYLIGIIDWYFSY